MRSKTKKSVSRLVGIWTFLLLFIFKGIFPKPAYAFLSSLDACAANPECAAAVSSELAPAVSAPTGAGFGASTLSTTTAAGATTSSVQGVAEISVAARLGTLGILYYWNQSQNEKAQEKAKEKYCAAYPTDLVCDAQANVVYNIEATLHSTDGTYSYDYFYSGTALGSINYAEADADHWITGWSPPLIGIYNNDGIRTGSLGWNYTGTGGYPVNEWAQITGITITSITRQDEQPETPPNLWKDWSQEKRDEAVRLLNDSDWQGLINSMPSAGILNPGDKINAPTIVIPGEETDDPNTPADERLLRKEHGFFTFPGNPDFDKDGIPDASDLDDDNDGTPDSSDPQPYNPNVPFASSLPDESGKVTPEVLQDIRDIVSPHENFQCVPCAGEIEAYLKEQGIHGERIKLDTVKQVDQDSLIYDDSNPPKAAPDYIISTNGHHEGIAIRINGEEKVFDNLHPDGVPREQWMNNLTYIGKLYRGDDFHKSGYLF
ncbi:hypothetical protein PI95_002245 [Hassallia byssoidea VB512170]|uniref:Tox-PL-2 domain-containing protein n=1 Tax=Hassallia byssoidea VB512170 TaxID=1304833 RepID=A0A846H2Y5_9CYAN|nr:papain fold toxin domain-containing protein [Hassalia byssoidea]NEU71428.1 hypothetical protein [Hassalia byssoidea VB512170]